ncbi:hypothetical protein ABEF92_002675 [Exophiala dermatitidis]|uniref:Zn(2)-C6 fungal-type domain-containing protein n=1 Tax=Exophiala dermatitidis (strain ATCC 34100 / CBS 525.76 / NIH/UT8656) TaxID=858893 RepID=H6BR02_EXODN|nr:uncharacterized protein HMPREF1120_02804 [Exophiala dermatitidis NIH/UT8656]EHY54637.1 hypothetical protein HMPREF1120_02804 [Exophiala dermatitidis NIH/UT8656]
MACKETAAVSLSSYGPDPIATTFAATDWVPGIGEPEMPAYSAAFDADVSVKRHAACDECRKRKLKCSGEPNGCERCRKQHLTCHYSVQKQMGRPRKRQKLDYNTDDSVNSMGAGYAGPMTSGQTSQDAPRENTYLFNASNPSTSHINQQSGKQTRGPYAHGVPPPGDGGSRHTVRGSTSTSPYDEPRTPPTDPALAGMVPELNAPYPTDVSLWPDFADMSLLAMPAHDSHGKEGTYYTADTSLPATDASEGNGESVTTTTAGDYSFDPDADPSSLTQLPAIPDCPCLPNLYLTLSTLSTLSALPISSGTIDTLLRAHRTGREVIYCAVCPQKFQSGSQNLMLSSTLLTVLADQWHRVKKATAIDLRKGFGAQPQQTWSSAATSSSAALSSAETDGGIISLPNKLMSVREDLEWRTFGYKLIRAYVFGDAPVPTPPDLQTSGRSGSGSNSNTTPALASSLASTPLAVADAAAAEPIYTLSDLCNALERRQRQWHGLLPGCHEFPARLTDDLTRGHSAGMTLEDIKRCEDETNASGDGWLCLKIARHTKSVMSSLDSPPPRLITSVGA